MERKYALIDYDSLLPYTSSSFYATSSKKLLKSRSRREIHLVRTHLPLPINLGHIQQTRPLNGDGASIFENIDDHTIHHEAIGIGAEGKDLLKGVTARTDEVPAGLKQLDDICCRTSCKWLELNSPRHKKEKEN